MATISKQQAREVLRRAGLGEQAERVIDELPDPIDLDRDTDWLQRKYGITRSSLLDALGGSP
jgi:hypothetical protein